MKVRCTQNFTGFDGASIASYMSGEVYDISESAFNGWADLGFFKKAKAGEETSAPSVVVEVAQSTGIEDMANRLAVADAEIAAADEALKGAE